MPLHGSIQLQIGRLEQKAQNVNRVGPLASNGLGLVVTENVLDLVPFTEVVVDIETFTNVAKGEVAVARLVH
jgi:hypothetical protein